MTLPLSYAERRAIYLKIKGRSLADIARDLKLDSCFVSKSAAEREAKGILEGASEKLGDVHGY